MPFLYCLRFTLKYTSLVVTRAFNTLKVHYSLKPDKDYLQVFKNLNGTKTYCFPKRIYDIALDRKGNSYKHYDG